MHFNGAGQATGWVRKSPSGVLMLPILAVLLVALLSFVAWFLVYDTGQRPTGGSSNRVPQRHAYVQFLQWAAAAMAGVLIALQLILLTPQAHVPYPPPG